MDDYFYQTVPRKTKKYDLLKESLYLKEYLLDTRTLSIENLIAMCGEYEFVFYRPNIGDEWRVGIIEKTSVGYKLSTKRETLHFKGPVELCEYIRGQILSKDFVLQQGVAPLHCDGRPFTIVVCAQRVFDRWDMSGIVTSVRSGKAETLEYALKGCEVNTMELRFIKAQLRGIVHQTGTTLISKYNHLREIAVTVIMDKNRHLFLSDVNTQPDFKLFSQLQDDTVYRHIVTRRSLINERTIKRIQML